LNEQGVFNQCRMRPFTDWGVTCLRLICGAMRFSTCYSLIAKRGFFIYQNFFSYELPVSSYFEPFVGRSNANSKYFSLWFEQHKSLINLGATFLELGQSRSSLFGYFTINMFVSYASFNNYSAATILRLFKILTYRGKRFSQRLPARGQRTHSNSAINVLRRRTRTVISQLKVRVH
jgi:hypothetical protein